MSNASQVRAFRMAFKSARQGAGFTLQDLADHLDSVGAEVSVGELTAWELGQSAPREWDRPTVEAIEETFGAHGVLVDALGW